MSSNCGYENYHKSWLANNGNRDPVKCLENKTHSLLSDGATNQVYNAVNGKSEDPNPY